MPSCVRFVTTFADTVHQRIEYAQNKHTGWLDMVISSPIFPTILVGFVTLETFATILVFFIIYP